MLLKMFTTSAKGKLMKVDIALTSPFVNEQMRLAWRGVTNRKRY